MTPRGRGGGYNNRDKRNIQCYNCNQFGHYNTECRKKAAVELHEQANYANEDAIISGSTALFVQQGLDKNEEHVWYLDSRASNHMCGHRDLFSDLDETIQGQVTFGDTSKVPVEGKGNISIKLKKALYGLKQAPRAWNTRIDRYFQENGFEKCPYEHAIYVKK